MMMIDVVHQMTSHNLDLDWKECDDMMIDVEMFPRFDDETKLTRGRLGSGNYPETAPKLP